MNTTGSYVWISKWWTSYLVNREAIQNICASSAYGIAEWGTSKGQGTEKIWPVRTRTKACYKWTTGDQEKIIFPPLPIKLGLMKEFVKALNTEGNCYQYIFLAFPGLSYEKVHVKTGVFDGPQIRQLIKNQNFNFITSYDRCREKRMGSQKLFGPAMTRLKITKMWLKQCFKVIIILGWTLAKFNQLKRNKRFDFIMLVWVQGSLFHIPVHKAWESQDSLYRAQIQKLLQCCQKLYTNRFLLYDSQKVQFDLSTTYRFIVIEKKVRGQIFVSTGVKQVKMLQFCWQWPQNACLVNTIQILDSLYV